MPAGKVKSYDWEFDLSEPYVWLEHLMMEPF